MGLITFNHVLKIQPMLTDCKPLPKPTPFSCLIITPLEQLAAMLKELIFLRKSNIPLENLIYIVLSDWHFLFWMGTKKNFDKVTAEKVLQIFNMHKKWFKTRIIDMHVSYLVNIICKGRWKLCLIKI